MSITPMQLYFILREKYGEQEARMIKEFVEADIEKNNNEKKIKAEKELKIFNWGLRVMYVISILGLIIAILS